MCVCVCHTAHTHTSEQCWVLSAAARISTALILGLLPFSCEWDHTLLRDFYKLQTRWRGVGKGKMKSTSQLSAAGVSGSKPFLKPE